jgi:thiol-disulfide isomerase/thioredoxin
MLNRLALVGICLAAWLAWTASATAQHTLEVGRAAPGLDLKKWYNGTETTIEPGKVYVIDFWSTSNASSKKIVPILNDFHKRHSEKGLVIIGVTEESAEILDSFIRGQGDRMSYRVGIDRNKSTTRAWMQAAELKNIPATFVVDRSGRVVYIGSALQPEFTRAVTLTLAGRYDPRKEKAALPALEAAERAAKLRNWRQAYKHLDDVIAIDRAIFWHVMLRKFEMMLAEEKNREAAYAYLKEQMEEYGRDTEVLGAIARDIAVNPKYSAEQRDLDVAMAAATAMAQSAGGKSPEALSTLALVLSARGENAEAAEKQMEAWMMAAPEDKAEYRRTLDRYRAATERAKASGR